MSKTLSKHDAALRRTYGVSQRAITDRIVRTFNQATPADLEAGAAWYPLAGELAADLAIQSGRSKQCCAAVISHLSPRNSWTRNVLGAHMLLVDKEVLPGLMGREASKAQAAIDRDQGFLPLDESAFGPKTLRFWKNIMGDHESVTIDVWALRAVGLDDTYIDRKRTRGNEVTYYVYDALEYAYQLVARRLGLEPATLQAVLWIVARGGRVD